MKTKTIIACFAVALLLLLAFNIGYTIGYDKAMAEAREYVENMAKTIEPII